MEVNSNQELIETIGELFLWDVVDDYICTNIKYIKEAISGLSYIEKDDVDKITSVEVQDSEEFVITEFSVKDGVLIVNFEMPAIMIAQSDNEDVCFRITTVCTGTLEIPALDSYDWRSKNFEDMDRPTLLSHKELVKILEVCYEENEVDDLMA